jgi:CBS domain-containing protein
MSSWIKQLWSTPVDEVKDRRALRPLVSVDYQATVAETLMALATRNVHAVPVTAADNEVRGFVDVRDIVAALLTRISNGNVEQDWSLWKPDYFQEAAHLMNESVGQIVNFSHIDKLNCFSTSTALEEIAFQMAGLRLHRVAIMQSDVLCSVLSISDLVNHIARNTDKCSTVGAIPVFNVLGLRKEAPVCITEDKPAIAAFQQMYNNQVSGIAVVDGSGALVANFSATDVRYMMLGTETILPETLFLPIHMFLLKQTQMNPIRSPVSVTTGASLHIVVQKMALFRVHRVWVVDNDNKPIGVVTPFDVLKYFLN